MLPCFPSLSILFVFLQDPWLYLAQTMTMNWKQVQCGALETPSSRDVQGEETK